MTEVRGEFKIEWHAKKILRDFDRMTSAEEKAVANRILIRLRKRVPKGTKVRHHHRPGKAWETRSPGRLRSTIRSKKSKFPDGGYIVLVGDDMAYYAYWVEHGTIFTYKQKFGRKGEQYMKKSVALEKARFTRNLKKKLGVI